MLLSVPRGPIINSRENDFASSTILIIIKGLVKSAGSPSSKICMISSILGVVTRIIIQLMISVIKGENNIRGKTEGSLTSS